MSKQRMWLVYEQNDSYEGGDVPLLVAGSESAAGRAVEQINTATRKLRERIDRLPDAFADGIAEDEYSRRVKLRDADIARMRWPFGLRREEYSLSKVVAAKPLPFVAEVR